jgi:hypothetical protein
LAAAGLGARLLRRRRIQGASGQPDRCIS